MIAKLPYMQAIIQITTLTGTYANTIYNFKSIKMSKESRFYTLLLHMLQYCSKFHIRWLIIEK